MIATIPVGTRPTALAVGAGGVWALNAGSGTVSHLDPGRNAVVGTMHVGRVLTGIAASATKVFVTVAGGDAPEPERRPASPARSLLTGSCQPITSGPEAPDLLIASDLPQFDDGGNINLEIVDMVAAIQGVLRAHKFRAGPYRVGYQACTDSEPDTSPDAPLCVANARAYAADASVVGVIGAYQSGCTGLELPILNTAPSGPVAVVSPSNTYVGLTHGGPQTGPDEPDRYFPTGIRNYVRITSPDDGQGAALAELARQLHRRRIYALGDGDPTSNAMITYVVRAARRLGVGVAGTAQWGEKGPYRGLAARIRAAHADAVVLTGCLCTNGGELVRDLRHGLGDRVAFLASDNFTCKCNMAGPGAPPEGFGLYITNAGIATTQLPDAGRRFVRRVLRGRPLVDVDPFVGTAAAAAEALLAAIAASDGTRGDVTARLTHERVASSFFGELSFDANGDPSRAPFTVYRVSPRAPRMPHVVTQGRVVDRVIEAEPSLAANDVVPSLAAP